MRGAALALVLVAGCATAAAPRQPFRAVGTEPFWALQIDSTGIRFSTPDDQTGTLYAPVVLGQAGDTLLWSAKAGDRMVEARIWAGTCSDGMSDRVWSHGALFLFDGTTYHGCAAPVGAPVTQGSPP